MTTKPTMSLAELAEKGADADLMRDMIQFIAQRRGFGGRDPGSLRPGRLVGPFGR